ncbi:MAG: sugar ABC transporter ATP-binding protein [Oscillospiraceae bacterium]|nr:sugar ABC transporter ATP-binding protein [Oscillospiraceae bacterium]
MNNGSQGLTLEVDNISKSFPGVKALQNVSFKATSGKVLALLGENGAGKSTLLKVLSGDIRPDEGEVRINGVPQKFDAPVQAIQAGVSVIYQERQLVPSMSVIENIYCGDLPSTKAGILRKREMKQTAEKIISDFGLDIDPYEKLGRLSTAHQQMVEIMKAYRRDSKIIAFDEPTASLTDTEVTILFDLIKRLKEEGKIILYVSHRLAEIFQITDEIVVLKDGRMVKQLNTAETNEAELIKAMVGRDIGDTYSALKRNDKIGDVLLEVKNLTTDAIHDVSFTLHRGEIVGFAGLVGAGRTEVVRAIFGADPIKSGEVILDGETVHFKQPKDAIEAGIALCPEDRKEQGLIRFRSVQDNVCLPVFQKMKKGLILDRKKQEALTEKAIEKYSIRTPSLEKLVVELSGGNQQKVILGRWTSELLTTKLLILDEPTKGIDVGTKAEIYQILCDLAREGKGVIFISSELPEVINIADTIIVMHNGHVTGTLARADATEEKVMSLAMLD